MGWVDPLVGLGWVHYSKSTKSLKGFFNAFKARLDKTWLHQAVKLLVVLGWVGLGQSAERLGLIGSHKMDPMTTLA